MVRVVGFGGSRESGGFVLGLSVGGDKGKGVNVEKPCLLCGEIRLPYGEVTVDGGEIGIEVVVGYVLVRGLTGLDRNGFGNAGLNIIVGEAGGDGVDVVERKVGPGPSSTGEVGYSSEYGAALPIGCDTGRDRALLGCGDAIGGEFPVTRAGDGSFCVDEVGKNCYCQI